jgi:hypothetical protein
LEWANGRNLNNKGDGSSPNPNDSVYYATRDIVDETGTSPTGLRFRNAGYLVFDYFTTDGVGAATVGFLANSSYHVLWKPPPAPATNTQRARSEQDGALELNTFDVDPASSPAYDVDYGEQTVGIYGEWERLPVGGVYLPPGHYVATLALTEESFHGSGGSFSGMWAQAASAEIRFTIDTTASCACPCHGDPKCDGATNVFDVVLTVDVAFRGTAPAFDPQCPRARTDVDCSGITSVADVVHLVDVAFRGAERASEYCDPCGS